MTNQYPIGPWFDGHILLKHAQVSTYHLDETPDNAYVEEAEEILVCRTITNIAETYGFSVPSPPMATGDDVTDELVGSWANHAHIATEYLNGLPHLPPGHMVGWRYFCDIQDSRYGCWPIAQ